MRTKDDQNSSETSQLSENNSESETSIKKGNKEMNSSSKSSRKNDKEQRPNINRKLSDVQNEEEEKKSESSSSKKSAKRREINKQPNNDDQNGSDTLKSDQINAQKSGSSFSSKKSTKKVELQQRAAVVRLKLTHLHLLDQPPKGTIKRKAKKLTIKMKMTANIEFIQTR